MSQTRITMDLSVMSQPVLATIDRLGNCGFAGLINARPDNEEAGQPGNVAESSFGRLREARDRNLPMPKLILHALQANVRGGRLPEPEGNGRRYMKFPLEALGGAPW